MRNLEVQIIGHTVPPCRDFDTADLVHLLRNADGVDGIALSAPNSPEGAKGVALDIATVAIGISGGLPGIVSLIDEWRATHRGGSIRLEIDGDVLELSQASQGDRAKLVAAWLSRHDD